MKLYRRKDLKVLDDKVVGTDFVEVDPADLDKMNLAALKMWKKLKSIYRRLKKKGVYDVSTGLLLDRIEFLESAADLKTPDLAALGAWATLKATARSWEDETLLREMSKIESAVEVRPAMTSDKDEELVPKGGVWDAVRHVFGQGLVAVHRAIDALEPTVLPASPEPKSRDGQEEPDYEAIVKETEEYMCKEKYRLRMEGYAMLSRASQGENFLRKLKAKHTPVSRETDVREKPEEKDD